MVTTPEIDPLAEGIATAVPATPFTVVFKVGPDVVPFAQVLDILFTIEAVLVYPATVILNVFVDEVKALNTELAVHGVTTPLSAT